MQPDDKSPPNPLDNRQEQEHNPGLTMADMLELPTLMRQIVKQLIRQQPMNLTNIAAVIKQDEAATAELLDQLEEKGFVLKLDTAGEATYQSRLADKSKRKLHADIWQALDDRLD